MRKLAFIFSLLLLPCILFGQESSGIDTTHIHHVEAMYYEVVGYGVRVMKVEYVHNAAVRNDQLMGRAETTFGRLPMLIDEKPFLAAFARLQNAPYVPFCVSEEDVVQCGQEFCDIDIYHFLDIMTTYGKDEYLGWVRSLIGKSEEELEANIKGAEMYPISLRAGTSCKVFYTESDYIEISFDHHLSPFTAILIRHGSGWGGRDGEWQKVNDDPLHHFYETTHLSALEAIPTKAEIIVEMFQTLPSRCTIPCVDNLVDKC